jgi:hypothetical protein
VPKLRVASVHPAIFLVPAIDASALVYLSQPRHGIVRTTLDIPVLAPSSARVSSDSGRVTIPPKLGSGLGWRRWTTRFG